MMRFTEARDFMYEKLIDELKPELTYHSIEHTLDVLEASITLAKMEEISEHDSKILQTAAIFHDSGMINTYIGHEDASVIFAEKYLPEFDYEQEDIDLISNMILTTKLPLVAELMSDHEKIFPAQIIKIGITDNFF